MRKPLPQALLLSACLYASGTMAAVRRVDTPAIVHVIDGNSSEWRTDKFESDKQTQVAYAADHDASYLYIILKVPDQQMQMKLMRQGMNLYFDRKGKKREVMGIGFPIKQNQPITNYGRSSRNDNPSGEKTAAQPDPRAIRETLASTMVLLKTFGFDDQQDNLTPIALQGGVNVSFDWDAADVMVIEYLVPLAFLGKPAELNGKPLGIGWKIIGITAPGGGGFDLQDNPAARPAGGAGNRGGTRTGSAPVLQLPSFSDARFKEQSIWTKYTLNF